MKYDTRSSWRDIGWRAIRAALICIISIVIVAGIGTTIWNNIFNSYINCMDQNDNTQIGFVIESGSSLSKIARQLEEKQLIRSGTVFKYYCDFAGFGQKIQAGDYLLNRSMDMFAIAKALTQGDGKPITTMITITPGMNVEETAVYLEQLGLLNTESINEYLNICKNGTDVENYYFVDDMLKQKNHTQRKYILEGYLAADTYEVYLSSKPLDIIKKLLSQSDKMFPEEYIERMREIGFTMDQTVTLASLIEKEAKNDDFRRVSSVFHNRLKQGMKLQSDPTVHYVTGERRMSLRQSDTAVQSQYNTYFITGLPVGPICSPSAAAIYAALYPDEEYLESKYLYFCSKNPDSGELVFSKTLQEHENAVNQYRPLWEEYDVKRGL